MANTSRKPWPARMYCSRIAPNSSWPAVSRTKEMEADCGNEAPPTNPNEPPVTRLPPTPSRPHCPAGLGCRPRCRSLCRSPQWWGHSQTRSRTGGGGKATVTSMSLQHRSCPWSLFTPLASLVSVSVCLSLYPSCLFRSLLLCCLLFGYLSCSLSQSLSLHLFLSSVL